MKQPLGLLWNDPIKSSERRTPPPRTWEEPGFIPCTKELDAALAFNVPRFLSWDEVIASRESGEQLVCDVEIYVNYFLVAFVGMRTGKAIYFEMEPGKPLDCDGVRWVLNNFEIVTFNGINFDAPIMSLAVEGFGCEELKHAANMLIGQNMRGWQVLRDFKTNGLDFNHVDLIEVAPLSANLKIYGGRLHVPRMKDLPFHPEAVLSPDQIAILRFYCINDLTTTAFLNINLKDQLEVRRNMSAKYGIDLRSKSDAQLAEAVIGHEVQRLTGVECERPQIPPGTAYNYPIPPFIRYSTDVMRHTLELIQNTRFVVADSGSIQMPEELKAHHISLGKQSYKMGIGGLHSTEETVAHVASEGFKIVDRDVTSYYPAIILNLGLFPRHLGQGFLTVYRSLVERRVAAKKSGNKIEADMLKIVVNGSFGKFGSPYSILYSPDLMLRVTITGQLSLLMLIERLELAGIEVVSANTDGIVMKYPDILQHVVDSVVAQWELDTGFGTEETEYRALYSRDVNNYIAVKPDGKTKGKGAYSNPWGEKGAEIFRFHKNPVNTVCIEAVVAYLTKGTPIAETIQTCRDVKKFVTVRAVKGGAVKDGEFLGKAVRWYYATGGGGEMVYATSGNKVPKSDGARPLMDLPDAFPDDVDYARYIREAEEILEEIGAVQPGLLGG